MEKKKKRKEEVTRWKSSHEYIHKNLKKKKSHEYNLLSWAKLLHKFRAARRNSTKISSN